MPASPPTSSEPSTGRAYPRYPRRTYTPIRYWVRAGLRLWWLAFVAYFGIVVGNLATLVADRRPLTVDAVGQALLLSRWLDLWSASPLLALLLVGGIVLLVLGGRWAHADLETERQELGAVEREGSIERITRRTLREFIGWPGPAAERSSTGTGRAASQRDPLLDPTLFVPRPEIGQFADLIEGLRTRREGAVLWLYGPTGNGKSWLLRHFTSLLPARGARASLVDMYRGQHTFSTLMGRLQANLGKPSASFAQRAEYYRTLLRDRSVDERALVEAKEALVDAFAQWVQKLRSPVVLLLDTFEKAEADVEQDVYQYLIGRILRGELRAVLVVAGWNPPPAGYAGHARFALRAISGLGEAEVGEYLQRRFGDTVTIDAATARACARLTLIGSPEAGHEFSGSNPLLLMLVTDLVLQRAGGELGSVTIDLVRQVVHELDTRGSATIAEVWIEQMVNRMPVEMRQFIESSAVPRYFSSEILAVLNGLAPAAADVEFERIIQRAGTFCYPRGDVPGQYQYHEEVRRAFVTYLRDREPQRFKELNRLCAEHFEAEREREPALVFEAFYHALRADEKHATTLLESLRQRRFSAELRREILERLLAIVEPESSQGWEAPALGEPARIRVVVPLARELGNTFLDGDRPLAAKPCFERILGLLDHQDAAAHEEIAQAYLGLARAERWTEGTSALSYLDRATDRVRSLSAPRHDDLVVTIESTRADLFRLRGDYPAAIRAAETAYRAASGSSAIGHTLGRIYVLAGRVRDGMGLYQRYWDSLPPDYAAEEPKQRAYLRAHTAEGFMSAGTAAADPAFVAGVRSARRALQEMEDHQGERVWPIYYGIVRWNLARNLEGRDFGSYALVGPAGPPAEASAEIARHYESAADAQKGRQYGFGEGWMRLDLARFLTRTGELSRAHDQTWQAIALLTRAESWHRLAIGLHNVGLIEHALGRSVPADLIDLTRRIGQGDRSAQVHRDLARCYAQRSGHGEPLGPPAADADSDTDCWFFDVLARLESLQGLAAARAGTDPTGHFQAALGLAVGHSPYELNRCLAEIRSELTPVMRSAIAAHWTGAGPTPGQWALVVRVWTEFDGEPAPATFHDLETRMIAAERRDGGSGEILGAFAPAFVPLVQQLRP
ncbi:MAG: AAA family ATPase [Micromonosporaceae bacterium]